MDSASLQIHTHPISLPFFVVVCCFVALSSHESLRAGAPAAGAGSSAGRSADAFPGGLGQKQVEAFLRNQLTLISKRDESVFSLLSDDDRLLGVEWTKKALQYDRKDRSFWRRTFPGYHRLRLDQLRGLRVVRLDGPIRTTLKRLSGGTELRPEWQSVSASFVLARVSIPGLAPKTCHVYLAEKRIYWRPFAW